MSTHRYATLLAGCLSLLTLPALAQEPTAPPPPVLGTTPPPAATPSRLPPATSQPAAASLTNEILGRTYSVELRSGTAFIGELTATTSEALTFQTKDLGQLVIQRSNLKQLNLLTQQQASRGYGYLGNGNRLFFAPTGRNLLKGEGTVQSIYVFLLSVNYGITDNISLGTLFTWVPGAGSDNFFALTPKVSFPVSENLRVGAGAIVFFQQGTTISLAYANGTAGSADNNVTAGVGYAFVGSSASSTPVFLLGGARRVSRRVSLLNESYILNITDNGDRATLVGGIAGLRLAGQRLSGSLGLLYAFTSFSSANTSVSGGGAVPFAEATFRFGRAR